MPRRRDTPLGPMEMHRPLAFDEVACHRNLACGRYAMCLEVVVRRQWLSFSCQLCDLWERGFAHGRRRGPAVILPLPLERRAMPAGLGRSGGR